MICNPVIAGGASEERMYKITNNTSYFNQTNAKAGEIVVSGDTVESTTVYVRCADGTELHCTEKRKGGFVSNYLFVMPAQDVTLATV